MPESEYSSQNSEPLNGHTTLAATVLNPALKRHSPKDAHKNNFKSINRSIKSNAECGTLTSSVF